MARPKAKREVILKSAAEVFAVKGFHDASISEIAMNANIGKGTVYEYFSSKNSLFLEVIRFTASHYLRMVKTELLEQRGFSNQIIAFLTVHSRIVEENCKTTGAFLATRDSLSAASENGEEIMGILNGIRNDTLEIITSILQIGKGEGVITYPELDFAADMFLEMATRIGIKKFHNQLADDAIAIEHQKLIQLFISGVGNTCLSSKGEDHVIIL